MQPDYLKRSFSCYATRTSPVRRLLIANLGAEDEFAGVATARPARKRAAALATLLRALISHEDTLWLPAAVAPEMLPPLPPWLAFGDATLRWGGLAPPPASTAIGVWCKTPALDRLFPARASGTPPEPAALPMQEGPLSLESAFWAGGAESSVVRWANDKRSLVALAAGCGESLLPGTAILRTEHELKAGSPLLQCIATYSQRWVVKLPWSASGRKMVHGRCEQPGEGAAQVKPYLARYTTLLIQPWVERVADFGLCAHLEEQSLTFFGAHQQFVDHRGQFCAAEYLRNGLPECYQGPLQAAARALGAKLRTAGFRGLFGVDGFAYGSPGDSPALQALGELNARCTFGFVGRLLASRTFETHPNASAVRLSLGASPPAPAAGWEQLPLVMPHPAAGVGVWLAWRR